jgi:hypothetical protein
VASSPLEAAGLPPAEGFTYDPAIVIDAVNRLVETGMGPALEALRGAQRPGASPDGILLVARVAFVPVDPGPLPRLELGRSDVDEERATRAFPLFPIALSGDVPFLIVAGYMLGGETDAGGYLDWCERHCRMREPLRPHDDPLAAAAELIESPEWAAAGLPGGYDRMVTEQAARLASASRGSS